MTRKHLELTPTFNRPYVIKSFLQQNKIELSAENYAKTDELMCAFQNRVLTDIDELFLFLQRNMPFTSKNN